MVYYRGKPLAWQTLDMIVDEKLIIETKATELVIPGLRYNCSATFARRTWK